MNKYYFAEIEDIPHNKFLIKEIKGISMGAICIDDEYHVIMNYCPHQGAEICRGKVSGTTVSKEESQKIAYCLKGQVLTCPWHGWEFNIKNGESLFASKKQMKIKKFRCEVEGDKLYVKI